MKNFVAIFLMIFGAGLIMGTVGRADYAIASRTLYSDFKLLTGVLIGEGIMILGAWLKGWFH